MFGFGLIVGLLIGGNLGLLVAALLLAAKNGNRQFDERGEVAANVASWSAVTVLAICIVAVLLGPWWG